MVVLVVVAMVAMVVARMCLLMMRPTKSKNLVLEGGHAGHADHADSGDACNSDAEPE